MNTVYFGDRKILLEEVKTEVGNAGVDIFEIEKQQIAVYDIRQAISFANKTSTNKKVIYLSSFFWSAETQNALLKIIEDTPPDTFFYLFGMAEKNFLPTVLSRVQKKNFLNSNRYTGLARDVLALFPNERLEHKDVKKIFALTVSDYDHKNDEEGDDKKDKESHVLFLQALVLIILENKEKLKISKKTLEQILQITTLADTKGGSPHLFIAWLLLSIDSL